MQIGIENHRWTRPIRDRWNTNDADWTPKEQKKDSQVNICRSARFLFFIFVEFKLKRTTWRVYNEWNAKRHKFKCRRWIGILAHQCASFNFSRKAVIEKCIDPYFSETSAFSVTQRRFNFHKSFYFDSFRSGDWMFTALNTNILETFVSNNICLVLNVLSFVTQKKIFGFLLFVRLHVNISW